MSADQVARLLPLGSLSAFLAWVVGRSAIAYGLDGARHYTRADVERFLAETVT